MSELNIYQRIHAVMKAVGYVQKEEKMVNNQYRFVSHDAVTAKIRPHLIEHGLVVIPNVIKTSQDGNRTEATIEVTFVNADKPEDRISFTSFGYGIDPQDKGPGKAVSYAVKYALLKVFCLETGDDPERDNIDHKPASEAKAEAKPAGKITPTAGVLGKLSGTRQEVIIKAAALIEKQMLEDKTLDAYGTYTTCGFDTDEYVALRGLLNSKTRSTLKRMWDEEQGAEPPKTRKDTNHNASLGSQA